MDSKKVLFYGAGEHAATIYRHARRKSEPYGEPAAFIDRDIYKQGHDLFGLPIISWEEAQRQYGDDFYIYITVEDRIAPEIIGFLLEQNFPSERIINYEPVEKRLGCASAENVFLVQANGNYVYYYNCSVIADNLFYKDITLNRRVISDMAACPDELKKSLEQLRNTAAMISEGACQGAYKNCGNCIERKTGYLFKNKKIRAVNLCGVAPCNFRCCYCVMDQAAFERFNGEAYPLMGDILCSLEQEKMIDEDTIIRISTGEFTVNEGGNQLIAEMTGKHPLVIFTNGYIFSFEAAKAVNHSGAIMCDLDSGTPESFRRVKGVEGFGQVSDHIREYARYGPVFLKYILLEDINDSEKDLEGFFKLADEVATRVTLTRDFLNISGRFSDRTLQFAAHFIKHFRDEGKLNMNMRAFVRSGEGERLNKMLENLEHTS